MVTIATIECGEANKHEFRNPYILDSILAKYEIDMKTLQNQSILH